jgi:hypothetical protein
MRFYVFGLLWSMVASAAEPVCHPHLWPAHTAFTASSSLRAELQAAALLELKQLPHPVVQLGSAGKVDLSDPVLIASRRGVLDADRAALFALNYQLTHKRLYLEKTRAILHAWAVTNQPTGHPIDETRLAGMLWAYDLIACALPIQEQQIILAWFTRLRAKKLAWTYGSITRRNNHHIHQLKMLLLLDKVLHDDAAFQQHSAEALRYTTINLDPNTGISVDYRERSALYYHNYVLQAWLEIGLQQGAYALPIQRAFAFLMQQMNTDHIHHEFVHSQAAIDKQRGLHGFAYAKLDRTFDVQNAVPTVVAYDTLMPETTSQLKLPAKPGPWLAFLQARKQLWMH